MKIIFMGTPEFAVKVLKDLIGQGHRIVCVITQPDRPKGRGKQIAFSAVKEFALTHDLAVEQPEKIKNNPIVASKIKSLEPDIIVVVAYGQILPKEILNIPKLGCINVHASLLPKYRGAAPIQWALINGETETGITIMQMNERLDAGDILLQKKVKIDINDDASSLFDKLFNLAGPLLLKVLEQIEQAGIEKTPQNEHDVSFAPSLSKMSAEIDWKKSAHEIHNRIRGLVPWPVAHTFYKEKMLRLWQSQIAETSNQDQPGKVIEIIKNQGIVVGTGSGCLLLKKVQLEAGKIISAYEFSLGHKIDKFPT